ncbi:MAG: Lrp/AsnC family transcriptional regulator, partial [Bacteroidota bacterium]
CRQRTSRPYACGAAVRRLITLPHNFSKTMPYQPDKTDLKILRILQEDSSRTHKSIAGELGMTTTPIFERTRRLEREGYIDKYMAVINKRKLGYKQTVFIGITLKGHTRDYLDRFVKIIAGFDEVLECHRISGGYDYLLKVVVKDVEAYENFIITKLTLVSDLGNVHSMIVLSTSKENEGISI